MNHPHARFVKHPHRLCDLLGARPIEAGMPYVIEKTVYVAPIVYGNLINDLTVDRDFIEKNASLCRVDDAGVWHCIHVKRRNCSDGLLIMSDGKDYPMWAAYLRKTELV